jgi:hypothetical protein
VPPLRKVLPISLNLQVEDQRIRKRQGARPGNTTRKTLTINRKLVSRLRHRGDKEACRSIGIRIFSQPFADTDAIFGDGSDNRSQMSAVVFSVSSCPDLSNHF